MASTREIVFSVLLFGAMLSSCVPDSVRDAQHVVAQADSLWREGKMYGVDAGDSATLAQAYHTLSSSIILPSLQGGDGGRLLSCYHYGRLLRAKDNPVEAMQVFIDATHTRTRDYHILGRVYSNMGSICHLAGEFPLSYDMYERSADMFLQNGDTLNYYYALNDMAFELAEQGREEETFALLSQIDGSCTDAGVLEKVLETKAEACFQHQRFDSAIHYAGILCATDQFNPIGLLVKAQSYSFLHIYDSATYYAKQVLSNSTSLYDIHNALYILTNDDIDQNIESIKETAAKRSDIQKILKIRQGCLSQAVQLLKQDLNRKPNRKWIFVFVAAILFICSVSVLSYVWHKRKVHARIVQEINSKQRQRAELAKGIAAMHSEISQLSEQQQNSHRQLLSDVEYTCGSFRSTKNWQSELCWNEYTQMCMIVNARFNNLAARLQEQNLSEREVRLCILVLIGNFQDKQIADILYYSYKTIRSTKRHVALKLGTTSANLRNFLLENVINYPQEKK